MGIVTRAENSIQMGKTASNLSIFTGVFERCMFSSIMRAFKTRNKDIADPLLDFPYFLHVQPGKYNRCARLQFTYHRISPLSYQNNERRGETRRAHMLLEIQLRILFLM